jgi:hypothetical protein
VVGLSHVKIAADASGLRSGAKLYVGIDRPLASVAAPAA